ncbi:hypothetical protein SAY87_029220 [Trapa incisa]|uniref:Transmembrane protein 128 n=1 Tax=Trapa incisa TaxID=236973 RepID=A0AAN7L3W7_9MYRT|nr:hypothetical protein SAY87_029220 [Trapa incisa]
MRQRHSQGYASSGDDLEDDAFSRLAPGPQLLTRSQTCIEIVGNILWIGSVLFIVYFGDGRANLIYLMRYDGRIRRLPLHLGIAGVWFNIIIFFYICVLAWRARRFGEKWELATMCALPYVTILGLISFCLLSFALWPIWGFLSLPLLFTLFMACMVVCPNIMIGFLRPQNDVLRID